MGNKLVIKTSSFWKHILGMLPIYLFISCSSINEIENSENNFINNEFVILKNVTINDTLKGNFIFDTGSNHTIINSKNIQKSIFKKSTVTDYYGNTDSISVLNNVTVKIYNYYLKKINVRIYNLSRLAKKYNIIGILGTDIISKFCWKFNYNTNIIDIKNIPYKNDSLSFINVNFNKKSIILDTIFINGFQKKNLTLDSGSLSEVTSNDTSLTTINKYHLKEHNLIQSVTAKKPEKQTILLSYNSEIKISKLWFKQIKLQTNPNYSNLIGLDFFPKNVLVFDGISSKFYFYNQPKIKSTSPSKRGFRFGLDENNNIIIIAIIENGESSLKGVQLGDKVVTLDNLNINDYKNRIDDLNQLRDDINEIVISRNNIIKKFHF